MMRCRLIICCETINGSAESVEERQKEALPYIENLHIKNFLKGLLMKSFGALFLHRPLLSIQSIEAN